MLSDGCRSIYSIYNKRWTIGGWNYFLVWLGVPLLCVARYSNGHLYLERVCAINRTHDHSGVRGLAAGRLVLHFLGHLEWKFWRIIIGQYTRSFRWEIKGKVCMVSCESPSNFLSMTIDNWLPARPTPTVSFSNLIHTHPVQIEGVVAFFEIPISFREKFLYHFLTFVSRLH